MVYLQSSTVLDTEIQRKKDICNFLATNRRRNKISMDMEGKDFKHTICTFLYLSAQAFGGVSMEERSSIQINAKRQRHLMLTTHGFDAGWRSKVGERVGVRPTAR